MAEGAVAAGGGEVALGVEGGVGCVGYEAGGGDVIIYGWLGSGGECDVLFFWYICVVCCEDESLGTYPQWQPPLIAIFSTLSLAILSVSRNWKFTVLLKMRDHTTEKFKRGSNA